MMLRVLLSMVLWLCVTQNTFAFESTSVIPGEGLRAEGKGEWQTAISVYLDHLLSTPNRIDLWLRVANIEHHLKNNTLTIDAYQHAIRLQPNNPVLHKTLSEIYAELNQPGEALLEINQAVKLKPDDIEYLTARANIANWNNKFDIALDSDKRILALSPDNAQALTGISFVESLIKKAHATLDVKPISVFDQFINQSNNEALLHHYNLAAAYMKKAIKLKPNDPDLYKKLSEIYASAKQAALALSAINQALNLAPRNLAYLRARATLAAWKGDKTQTLDSYERILLLKPHDQDALLNLAHTLAWQGKTDEALCAYQRCLSLYPHMAEGWIQYADVLSWTANYIGSFDALQHYWQIKSDTIHYMEVKARVLAMMGRFKSSLAINESLLQAKPADPYLLSTDVVARTRANQLNQALVSLKKLESASPDDPHVSGLKDITLTPIRSNINAEGDYTNASDTTKIQDLPVSAQYFLTPTTSLLFQGLYERATAAIRSGLEPVDGKHSIFDESAKIGFTTQINALNLKGLIGGLHIQNKNNHGIYDAALNTNLGETAQITMETLHDLYRPYLVPQTPRLISLQVMETRVAASLQWQPFVQKYLNVTLSHSDLTDNNSYTHLNFWPKSRVYDSERWMVTVGVDGDFWRYRRRATDGYYSPKKFNGYEGTIELYYAQSENIGFGFSGGFGAQKDEALPHYFYEEDLAVQMFMGIFTDWELQLKGGYTLRENQIKNYYCWTTGIVLTRRF